MINTIVIIIAQRLKSYACTSLTCNSAINYNETK